MKRIRHHLTAMALASCATAAAAQSPYPQPVYANGYGQPAPLGDADQLAQELRALAADPTNLFALINAARLSLKLGDTDAAAALYTRADKASPNHPQVKAGMARLLVNAQRPGEALRLFQEATTLGAGEREFGADRALAYDLIGEQERAQREYRAILRRGSDDEATRRYALSLGISGLKDPALALLEPLNRRGDRGAWRVRAFVLAMAGDRPGADRIATTMMPAGMADGLKPFFDRLPRLNAADRAFAVHFGEVRGNAVRYADARRAPPLPALSPEPNPFPVARAPIQLATAATAEPGRKGKRGKKERAAEAARLAAAQSYAAPLPQPPAPTATQLAALSSTRLPPPPDAYGVRAAPARTATILPPPPDAYRPRETRLAAAVPATTALRPAAPSVGTVTLPSPVPSALDAASDRVTPTTSPMLGGAAATAAPAMTAPVIAPVTAPVATAATLAPQNPPTAASTPAPVGALGLPSGGDAAIQTVALPASTAAPVPTGSTDSAVTAQPAAAAGLLPATPSALAANSAPAPVAVPSVGAVPAVAPAADTVQAAVPSGTPAATPATDALAAFTLASPSATGSPGTPPAPRGEAGDTVLAAIVANIQVPPSELRNEAPAPLGETRLLSTVERKQETRAVVAAARERAALPAKDARGRFVDTRGRPLLDPRGRPMDARAAAAWLAAQKEAAAPALKKDARGRYVDARGRPLLDARGRPLDARAAAARLATQDDPLPPALKKDARGRFVDARGRPLLDERGEPMDAKAAAAWLAARGEAPEPASEAPRKDARGRFLDARGRPLLDARGRPLDARAAAAKLAADAKKPEPAKEPGRIWVQVAGGANEATLAREWQRVSEKTPALRGRQGWTTPLRATNRILTGPFKSGAEAMAFVNTLKKQGLDAFMFTSDAGQKITRLGAK